MKTRWTDRFFQKISNSGIRAFSEPYLPSGIILAGILIAFSDLALILIHQPIGYWHDTKRVDFFIPFVQSLLSTGPAAYILAGLGYLLVLALLLTILQRRIAFILWLPISFIHGLHALTTVEAILQMLKDPSNTATGLWVAAVVDIVVIALLLSSLLLRKPGPGSKAKRLIASIFAGLWIVAFCGWAVYCAIIPRTGWQKVTTAHKPGNLGGVTAAYDPDRQKLVLFGGASDWIGKGWLYENSTWEWDGKDWTEIKTSETPSARKNGSLAYDPVHKVMVMFGGENFDGKTVLSDTWIFDGNSWKMAETRHYPAARQGAQLFFDPNTNRIILAGGFKFTGDEKKVTRIGDAYAWDGEDWSSIEGVDREFAVTTQANYFDPSSKTQVVYDFSNLVAWQNSDWLKITTNNLPPGRFGPGLAVNPETGNALLFGGIVDEKSRNDTWMLRDGTWQELHPESTPAIRDGGLIFYDPVRKSFMLYGGYSRYTLDDMWELEVNSEE